MKAYRLIDSLEVTLSILFLSVGFFTKICSYLYVIFKVQNNIYFSVYYTLILIVLRDLFIKLNNKGKKNAST